MDAPAVDRADGQQGFGHAVEVQVGLDAQRRRSHMQAQPVVRLMLQQQRCAGAAEPAVGAVQGLVGHAGLQPPQAVLPPLGQQAALLAAEQVGEGGTGPAQVDDGHADEQPGIAQADVVPALVVQAAPQPTGPGLQAGPVDACDAAGIAAMAGLALV